MFSVLFWLVAGLLIGVLAGAIIFVVGMVLVGLVVGPYGYSASGKPAATISDSI